MYTVQYLVVNTKLFAGRKKSFSAVHLLNQMYIVLHVPSQSFTVAFTPIVTYAEIQIIFGPLLHSIVTLVQKRTLDEVIVLGLMKSVDTGAESATFKL